MNNFKMSLITMATLFATVVIVILGVRYTSKVPYVILISVLLGITHLVIIPIIIKYQHKFLEKDMPVIGYIPFVNSITFARKLYYMMPAITLVLLGIIVALTMKLPVEVMEKLPSEYGVQGVYDNMYLVIVALIVLIEIFYGAFVLNDLMYTNLKIRAKIAGHKFVKVNIVDVLYKIVLVIPVVRILVLVTMLNELVGTVVLSGRTASTGKYRQKVLKRK